MSTDAVVLETQGLCKSFGALEVASNIQFTLQAGARHALIGPNGAGKTSFVNLLTGVLTPSAGTIVLRGRDVTALDQARRARLGLARTFQINQLFRSLTVLENVVMAIAERERLGRSLFKPLGWRSAISEEAIELLQRVGLAEQGLRRVDALAYGQQRLLEVAIALAQRPKVLILDEPAAGLPSAESHRIAELVEQLDPELALLIIEHDMELVFRLANQITVLVSGAVFAAGTPDQIAADARVRAVYLGEAS
ncbi:MAG: ABC transporter ATP-binding protein [Candidatus Competibacteraceae bacterium]|nr:ABC transporter ATP-binding protein [Candidatus Competibacteraceae bacterium]